MRKLKHIENYDNFILNEIKAIPLYTESKLIEKPSLAYKNEKNFEFHFETTTKNKYVLDFICIYDNISPFPNRRMFNISFTKLNQHDINNPIKYERETNDNEHIELFKRLLYVFDDAYNNTLKQFSNIFIIGETKNIKKINFYRNVIGDSTKHMGLNYKEYYGDSSINLGKKVYYYEII